MSLRDKSAIYLPQIGGLYRGTDAARVELVRQGVMRYHARKRAASMKIEIEREDDGRWIAEAPDLPGVMVYGKTRQEAIAKVEALALRVLADRLEHGD
jgi:predicted RNase H-like HicB family nuclease